MSTRIKYKICSYIYCVWFKNITSKFILILIARHSLMCREFCFKIIKYSSARTTHDLQNNSIRYSSLLNVHTGCSHWRRRIFCLANLIFHSFFNNCIDGSTCTIEGFFAYKNFVIQRQIFFLQNPCLL